MEQAPQPNTSETNTAYESAKNDYLESWDKLEKAHLSNEAEGNHAAEYGEEELGVLEQDRDAKKKEFEELGGNAQEVIAEFKKQKIKDLRLSPENTEEENRPPNTKEKTPEEEDPLDKIIISAKEFEDLKQTVATLKDEIKKLNERLDGPAPTEPIEEPVVKFDPENISESEARIEGPNLEQAHQQAAPLFEKLETLQDEAEKRKVQDIIMKKIYGGIDKPTDKKDDLPDVNLEEYEDPIHIFIKPEDREKMGKNEDGLEDQDLFYIAREDPHPNLERNFEGNFAEVWNRSPQAVRQRWANDIRSKRKPYIKMSHGKKQPLNEGFIDWILRVFLG